MIFAVATSSTVLIYSTEKQKPIFGMGNYHYAALTDLCWKNDRILALSSSDGFCSFMMFEEKALGETYEPTGELANLMKVTEWVPKPMNKTELPKMEEGRVEYRETENGQKKKRIIPKKVADI